MKLSEMGILVAKQNSSGIDTSKFDNFKHIGNLDGYQIMKTDSKDYWIMIKLQKDDVDVCYFIGLEFENNIQIKRTWVNEEFRNKGLMTNLYKKIYLDFNYDLISDFELSPESKSIWTKLISVFPNNVYLTDKNMQKFNKISDITDYFLSDNFVIILKHDQIKNESKIPKNLFQTILKDYQL